MLSAVQEDVITVAQRGKQLHICTPFALISLFFSLFRCSLYRLKVNWALCFFFYLLSHDFRTEPDCRQVHDNHPECRFGTVDQEPSFRP